MRQVSAPGIPIGYPGAGTSEVVKLTLGRGDTLVLYTDGLVERRDQVFDDGIELLGRALAEERTRPAEQLCDALLARLIPDGAEDDVALVGVRLL